MASTNVPEWVNQQQFIGLLKQNYHDFQNIQKFEANAAISGGENYLTIVQRIQIEMQTKDETIRRVSYILKLPLVNDRGDEHDFHDLFVTEAEMYDRIVPELEALYVQHANLSLKFKPLHMKFTEATPKCDYILMEDLRQQGYKNLDRMSGLALPEMEAVLRKLAQFHAVSALRVSEVGEYNETLQQSYFGVENIKMLEHMNNTFNIPFLECMQHYNLSPAQLQLITNYTARLTDLYIEFGSISSAEFNVLNHGDFWCNNFMFKYDDSSAIEDVCFVDFQLPKFGTPAHDLFHLLMTTPQMDIKLEKFDYFIAYYHEQLLAHLKLLNYSLKLPTLTELHTNLRKNGLWAFVCAQRMLPVVLLPSSSDSNIENFMSDSEVGVAFKRKMMLNPNYVQQIAIILPWLIERNYIQ